MKKSFKAVRCFVLALLVLNLFAASALAESDGFVSSAGIFEWFVPPDVRPQKNVKPHDGWIGTYYAPGTGLEMNIWDLQEGEGVLHCSIVNYANPDETVRERINETLNPVDGGFQSPMGGMTLHDFDDGKFTMDIDGDFVHWLDSRGTPFYGSPTTVEFTDVTKLMENPMDDRWGGAYFYDDTESANTFYLSFVQLYGTSDYFLVKQREVEGKNMGNTYTQTVFLTEDGGELMHNHGYSIVTEKDYIECYVLNDVEPQRYVSQYAGDNGIVDDYYWCSDKTMWGD